MAWREINIGTGLKTAEDFNKAIMSSGCRTLDWQTHNLLEQKELSVNKVEQKLTLVNISVVQLGFQHGATIQSIYGRAQEVGLDLCSPEVGPQLRMQYPNQSTLERIHIGMEPIVGLSGQSGVFLVEHDSMGRHLKVSSGAPRTMWGPDEEWVFVLPD